MTTLPSLSPAADERTTLGEFLEYHRAVARRKAEGLTDEQLRMRLPGHPSSLSVGAIVHHLASVEDWWWQRILRGDELPEPWATGWETDDDFDFHVDGLGAAEILAQFDASVAAARTAFEGVDSLDALSALPRQGNHVNVRWILVHLVEEYARHCGQLDLLREAIDGATGD